MGDVLNYTDEVTRAMAMLATHPKTLFVGQQVRYDGQALFETFSDVPMDRRIEMPVAEDFQMGFCTGMALQGYIPICFFPRIDFLVLALNQLVNHLDKIPIMSGYRPKVIVRTAVGSTIPLNAGLQHTQDHTDALHSMLKTITVHRVTKPETVMPAYVRALESERSSLIVEYMSEHAKS